MSLTKDDLYIGHHISDTDKKTVGKFVWENGEQTETKISKGIFLKNKLLIKFSIKYIKSIRPGFKWVS